MGSISGFGTVSAALISALAVSATTATAANDAERPSVSISVEGLRNSKGYVLICLTTNPKAFPDCSKDKAATRARVSAAEATQMRFPLSAAGTYAISLVHDENSNGKLDIAVMIPREGFGFSRNPAIGFGPPKFKSAAFTVGVGTTSQTIKMKYML